MLKRLRDTFTRKSTAKALPAPTSPDFRRHSEGCRLFQDSLLGEEYRTLAYSPEDSPQSKAVWQKAVYNAPHKWVITEIQAQPYDPESGEPVIAYAVITDNLCYFEAVERLAAFENSQKELGRVQTGPGEAELEFTYFRTMAEQEGIIFDTQNIPHPTLNGEIITSGKFTEESLKTARAFRRDPQRYENLGHILLTNMTRSTPLSQDASEAIFRKMNTRADLRDFVGNLTELYKDAAAVLSNNKEALDLFFLDNLNSYTRRRTANCEKIIQKLPLDESEKKTLQTITSYCAAVTFMMIARNYIILSHKGQDGQNIEEAQSNLTLSLSHYAHSGGDEQGADRIRGYVFNPDIPEDITQEMPSQLKQYIKAAKKLRDIADKEVKQDMGQRYHNYITKGPNP